MQVTVKYNDADSFTVEEVVKQAQHNYGKAAVVKCMPDSTNPHDLIYFGLQQILTYQQLGFWYDDQFEYPKNLQKLRSETLYKIQEILDSVIIDNESKLKA